MAGRWAGGAVFALVLTALPLMPAHAAMCDAGTECDVHLTNTNVLGVTIDILVHIDNRGTTTVLTVSYVSDNLENTPLGIDLFGYNSNSLATVLPGSWQQADCNPPGQDFCTMNGFGRMLSEIDDSGGDDLTFNFTLDALVTSFPENARGSEFIAHIRFSDGCSVFVSDGIAESPSENKKCEIVSEVPEPATLLLLAIGLLGLAIARRAGRSR